MQIVQILYILLHIFISLYTNATFLFEIFAKTINYRLQKRFPDFDLHKKRHISSK